MRRDADEEFREICRTIVEVGRSEAQWALVESDDMFQSRQYRGGFDATEGSFCSSYYSPDGSEYWFQVGLESVKAIARGEALGLELRVAE
jgi:hypothetical protein